MTIAYFDCFNGASGDMIVGALLAAGADLEMLKRDLAVLGLDGVTLASRRVERQGIFATKFDVTVRGEVEGPAALVETGPSRHEHAHTAHDHGHGHEHEAHDHPHESDLDFPHGNVHAHAHKHDREHSHDQALGHAHAHRTLADVEAVLDRLPEPAQGRAKAVFRRLAEAEAKVHGTTAPFVHFHEVGMDDAIADVAAAVLCMQQLNITEVQCSPLPLGSGMVRCAHGLMPVPVPAVVELLAGVPSYDNGERGELVTPTGAALLTALATRFGPAPAWTLSGVGYGAGTREGQKIPNLLRVMLGERAAVETDTLVEVTANIDDLNPQLYGPLSDRLLKMGALDVTLTPTHMKKGRPGIILAVLCADTLREPVAELLFRETTTLGVRHHSVTRQVLARELRKVSTPWGEVTVKIGLLKGEAVNVSPEFDDCHTLAEASGRSIKEVWQEALSSARREVFPA